MNLNNLTPRQKDVLKYVAQADGDAITGHDIAEHFDMPLNSADNILLALTRANLLDRRYVDDGRRSHYGYWPREDERGRDS